MYTYILHTYAYTYVPRIDHHWPWRDSDPQAQQQQWHPAQQESAFMQFFQRKFASDWPSSIQIHGLHTATCKLNGNRSDGVPVVNWYKSAVEKRWEFPFVLQDAVCWYLGFLYLLSMCHMCHVTSRTNRHRCSACACCTYAQAHTCIYILCNTEKFCAM